MKKNNVWWHRFLWGDSWSPHKWSIQKKVATGFGLIAAMSIATSWTGYRTTVELVEAKNRVTHTYQVLENLEQVLSSLKDVQAAQWGYVLTGQESFLEHYDAAISTIDQDLNHLRDLTADNLKQQRLDLLELLIRKRLALASQIIDLRQHAGFVAASQVVLSGQGRRLTNRSREVVREMKEVEQALLKQRSQRSETITAAAVRISLFSLGLNLTILSSLYFLINREMAARQQANAQLQTYAKKLERSNRDLQDFAYVASHDLQEPLRKIQAFGDRLKLKHADALGDQGQEYLARMQDAARRMSLLIQDLLSFSRVTTKARPFVTVDLAQVVQGVVSDLEARIEQVGGRVESENLPTIEADPLQMPQLMQNLVSNALKFHRPEVPPVVRVQGHVEENSNPPHCQITVSDNGIGFEEKYQERIFNAFERLHGHSSYEGTGMGLAICRKIAEHHGGNITAQGTLGQGSTFTVTLPRRQDVVLVDLPPNKWGRSAK